MYGGTKEEMQRLLKDAQAITGVKYDISNLSNVYDAIGVIQDKLGITGTTAREASTTIEGSMNSMKAAWSNMLVGLVQGGDTYKQCVSNLVESVKTFAKNIMPAIQQSLQGIGDLIKDLAPIISKEIPNMINSLLPPLLSAATDIINGLVNALPPLLSSITKVLPQIATSLLNGFVSLISGLLNVLQQSGGQIISTLVNSLNSAVQSLLQLIPQFITVGMQLIDALIQSVAQAAPMLIPAIVNAAVGLVNTLIGELPAFIQAGMQLLQGLVQGIMNAIPSLLQQVPVIIQNLMSALTASIPILINIGLQIITTLIQGIVNNLPVIIQSAIQIINSLVQGLINMIPTLISAAQQLISGLVNGLLANLPIIIQSAIQLVLSLVQGLVNNIPLIVGGALQLIVGLTQGLLNNLPTIIQAGIQIIVALIQGIVQAIPQLIAMVPQIFSGLWDAIKSINWIDLGKSIISGIWDGVKSLGKSLWSGVKSIFGGDSAKAEASSEGKKTGSSFSTGLTSGIDTQSQGLQLSTNFANGITNGQGAVTTAAQGLSTQTSNAMSIAAQGTTKSAEEVSNQITGSFSKMTTQLNQLPSKLTGILSPIKSVTAELSRLPSLFTQAFSTLPAKVGSVSRATLQFKAAFRPLAAAITPVIPKLRMLIVALVPLVQPFRAVAMSARQMQTSLQGVARVFTSLASSTRIVKASLSVIPTAMAQVTRSCPPLASAVRALQPAISSLATPLMSTAKSFNVYVRAIIKSTALSRAFLSVIKNIASTLNRIAVAFKLVSASPDLFSTAVTRMVAKSQTMLNQLVSATRKTSSTMSSVFNQMMSSMNNILNRGISQLVSKAGQLPNKMGSAIRSSGGALTSALTSVWSSAVSACQPLMNKLISGANFVLKQFGSGKSLASWKGYAKGTDGHKGGNAVVNDGNGAELVQMPNGNTFIPKGKNVLIPNAPKGMKVLPAEQTAQVMGRQSPTFNYADGTGDFDVFSYIGDSKGLVNKIANGISYGGMSGITLDIGKGMVTTVTNEMVSWVDKMFEEFGAKSLASYVASGGVEQWRSTVIQALKMTGQYSEANVQRTLYQMQTESGGNPRAINLWDSNARKGIPSKGLMQCIDPTFKAYAMPGFNSNIYDPLSNILASVRYATSRYGSLARAYQGHGYANGGIANKPSIFGEDGSEMAIPLSQSKRGRALSLWEQTGSILGAEPTYTPESSTAAVNNTTNQTNNYSPSFTLNLNGASATEGNKRKVMQWIKEAMNEVFENLDNDNPPVVEI